MEALRCRPIAVSNTDNRLISTVLRKLITPAILPLLNPHQIAFRPGVPIDKGVNLFNERFYGALAQNRNYHILFHDFQRAYDNMSRAYLLSVLSKIGLPQWSLALLSTLLSSVIALPILQTKHGVKIPVTNGLKQGCPLSPILFNLGLDPLVSSLEADLDTLAFADDLAIGHPNIHKVLSALKSLEAFHAASGSASNMDKTRVISTTMTDPSELSPLLPSRWKRVTLVESHLYLGILFGRQVTVECVFSKPLQELQRRAAAYQPLYQRYTEPGRILITNCFLLPTLSYVQRFFLMPPDTLNTVWRVLKKWLLNDSSKHAVRLFCMPSNEGGLANPLRNPELLNLATLLRLQPQECLESTPSYPALPLSPATPLPPDSRRRSTRKRSLLCEAPLTHSQAQAQLRMTLEATKTRRGRPPKQRVPPLPPLVPLHIRAAVDRYTALTGSDPEPDVPQKALFIKLAGADPSRWDSYTARVTRRYREGKIDAKAHDAPTAKHLASALQKRVKEAASKAPSMPRELRAHLFSLIHHTTPTLMRQRVYGHISSLDCRLCGRHAESLDHLLSPGKCCVTREAIRVAQLVAPDIADISQLTSSTSTTYELITPPDPSLIPIHTAFSLAVIRTCRQAGHLSQRNLHNITSSLIFTFLDILKAASPKYRNLSPLTIPIPTVHNHQPLNN